MGQTTSSVKSEKQIFNKMMNELKSSGVSVNTNQSIDLSGSTLDINGEDCEDVPTVNISNTNNLVQDTIIDAALKSLEETQAQMESKLENEAESAGWFNGTTNVTTEDLQKVVSDVKLKINTDCKNTDVGQSIDASEANITVRCANLNLENESTAVINCVMNSIGEATSKMDAIMKTEASNKVTNGNAWLIVIIIIAVIMGIIFFVSGFKAGFKVGKIYVWLGIALVAIIGGICLYYFYIKPWKENEDKLD